MSARKERGSGEAWGAAAAAHRRPGAPCSEKPPAPGCREIRKPPQRAANSRQLLAAAQAAGRRDVLTPCRTKTSALHQRPPSGMQERLGRSSRPATIPRINGLRIPPDLLNPLKGLSMAKTAGVSLQLAMKFVPVAELPKGAQIQQSRTRETVIQRRYTLCEAVRKETYGRRLVVVGTRATCSIAT